MQVTEMRRSQARAVANDLVAQGQLARDQMSAAVDELVEMSRRRTDDLRKVVQKEVHRQLSTIGIATKADLAALERRLARAQREHRTAPGQRRTTAKRAPAKRAPAKKVATKAV
jgi:polyhydroxyalkanoate synthesis regulator phasin